VSMSFQDIDESILVHVFLNLTSSEVCRLPSTCKTLKGLFEGSASSGFSTWHSLLAEVNKGRLGSVSADCIWLHALLDTGSIASVARMLCEMGNPIKVPLKFECASAVECFSQAMKQADAAKDFVIQWQFYASENSKSELISSPVHFSCGFLAFTVQLCATRASPRSVSFEWRSTPSCFLLMEEADMVGVQVAGSILTPFGSVPTPNATVRGGVTSHDADGTHTMAAYFDSSLLAETWLYDSLVAGEPLTSRVSVNCSLLGMMCDVTQASDSCTK